MLLCPIICLCLSLSSSSCLFSPGVLDCGSGRHPAGQLGGHVQAVPAVQGQDDVIRRRWRPRLVLGVLRRLQPQRHQLPRRALGSVS